MYKKVLPECCNSCRKFEGKYCTAEDVLIPSPGHECPYFKQKDTVVFDFDGVIHSYKSGWKGETVIPDPPVPGIREAIAEMREAGYEVIVVSTRCATMAGMSAVGEWLGDNQIFVDGIYTEKPPAVVYIDDRAICFDGHPEKLLEKVSSFKPWYK